jgi:N-methylhydantoinase B
MTVRIPDGPDAAASPTSIAVQAGRFRYPPAGIFGGKPGAKARFLRNGEDADPSGLTLCRPGDVVTFVSAGGGGCGDPMRRDAEAVEKDVRLGYVSIDGARRDYGVVIDPATLTADRAETERLRAETQPRSQNSAPGKRP